MEERSGVCSCSVIGCPKASLQTFVFDDLASSTTGNGARSCIISRCLSVPVGCGQCSSFPTVSSTSRRVEEYYSKGLVPCWQLRVTVIVRKPT